MVAVEDDGAVSIEIDVYLHVDIAIHVVMVIMQFMERTWPWSSEWLEARPDYDPQVVVSGPCVVFPLPRMVIARVRRGGSIESYR